MGACDLFIGGSCENEVGRLFKTDSDTEYWVVGASGRTALINIKKRLVARKFLMPRNEAVMKLKVWI